MRRGTLDKVASVCVCSFFAMQSLSSSAALLQRASRVRVSNSAKSAFVPTSRPQPSTWKQSIAATCRKQRLWSALPSRLGRGARSIGDGFPRTTLMSTRNVPQVTTDWEHGAHVGGYSDYIDVRAPCEFQEDHIPGAVNLPVLDNAQRIEVGTLYKMNPFEARRLGARYVAENLSRMLQDHFADKGKDYKPLVYCWRGGQRSGSLSRVLAEIGYRVSVLEGGYKTYRNDVMSFLREQSSAFTFNVVSGPTGSCKTRLLSRMRERGLQVVDLEAMARHRGSVLGEMGPQPSQKWFESQLALRLRQLDPALQVWIEAESNNIGKRCMPQALMDAMQRGVRFQLEMPLDQRVKCLLEDYAHLGVDTATLRGMMKKLARFHSKAQMAEWGEMIEQLDGHALVESLLVNHYDPTYTRSHNKLSSKHDPPRVYIPLAGGARADLDACIDVCLTTVRPDVATSDSTTPVGELDTERARAQSGSETLARV